MGEPSQHDGDQRDDDVELLFDRERPVVQDGRRRVEAGAVPVAVEDESPIGHVREAGDDVAAQVGQLIGVGPPRRGHGSQGQTGQCGRQQAPEAPVPEMSRARPGARSLPLTQQEVRDQEARQGEEERYPEKAAGQQTVVEVVDDDREHRDAAQPIECADVAESRSSGCRADYGRRIRQLGRWSERRSHRCVSAPRRDAPGRWRYR